MNIFDKIPTDEELLAHSKEVYARLTWNKKCTVAYVATSIKHGHCIASNAGAGCHASLTAYNPNPRKMDYVLHAVSCDLPHYNKAQAERYYDYLFNRSPFAEAYLTKDVGSIYTKGIAVNAHRMANPYSALACKAIRHTWEHPGIPRTMGVLVDTGLFTEDQAFYWAFGFKVNDKLELHSLHHSVSTGHVALYLHHHYPEAYKNWVDRSFQKAKLETMAERGGYWGTESLWNNRGRSLVHSADKADSLISYFKEHSSFNKLIGSFKDEVTPNPFGLLAELFTQTKTPKSLPEVLKEFSEDVYNLTTKDKKEKKVA